MKNERYPLDLVMKRSQGSFSDHFSEEVIREMIAVDGRVGGREESGDTCSYRELGCSDQVGEQERE